MVFRHILCDRLDWIEFRSIGRQARLGDLSVLFFEPGLDFGAAMGGDIIPEMNPRRR